MSDINARGIFEEEVLYRLINDGGYFGSVVPLMKPSYFSEVGNSMLFDKMQKYYVETGEKPNLRELIVLIKDDPRAQQDVSVDALKKVQKSEVHINESLLINKTEDFIRKAIHTESLILGAEGMGENNDKKLAESFRIAEEAQKVTLDSNFGTSLFDIDDCIEYYQDDSQGLIPLIPSFDYMMGRGFLPKTLHTFLAPPGVGKSATLSAFACEFVKQQKDVVIFTLEMDEAEWLKRIYANLLDIDISNLEFLDPSVIKDAFEKNKDDFGTLMVKEFPSYAVTAIQMQNFLEKYMVKLAKDRTEATGKLVTTAMVAENLVVCVDYLGLMSSSRMPTGTASYEYVKSITAELRGVAQKLEIAILTAHQLNRSAIDNVEAGQASVSDSAGISMFSDSMIMLLQDRDRKLRGEIVVNFEKNRMTGKTNTITMGFDYQKMRFVDSFYRANMEKMGAVVKQGGVNVDINTGLSLGAPKLPPQKSAERDELEDELDGLLNEVAVI